MEILIYEFFFLYYYLKDVFGFFFFIYCYIYFIGLRHVDLSSVFRGVVLEDEDVWRDARAACCCVYIEEEEEEEEENKRKVKTSWMFTRMLVDFDWNFIACDFIEHIILFSIYLFIYLVFLFIIFFFSFCFYLVTFFSAREFNWCVIVRRD